MGGAEKKKARRQPALYEALDFILLRAPLLPAECCARFEKLAPPAIGARTLSPGDPWVRLALATGSPSLLEALERTPPNDKKAPRLMAKLRRFLIRMSMRPTPYGAFAGVALAAWGERTDVSLDGSPSTRTRLSMDWLVQHVLNLEAQPAIRNQLRWIANQSAWMHHGRVMLAEHVSLQGHVSLGASIAATPMVRRALELARAPIAHTALADQLLVSNPAATTGKVERLLQRLWDLGFLLTELMPPMTVEDPAGWVRARLAQIIGGKALCVQLDALARTVGTCDATRPEDVPGAQRKAAVHASLIRSTGSETPLQVDMALKLGGRKIASIVAEEAARTAELLLRLSPFPNGPPHVTGYRQAFLARYGHDREVPLLELVHPEWGLGPIGQQHAHGGGADWQRAAQRVQALQHLALGAIREGKLAVELDEELLSRLETQRPAADSVPSSVDLNIFVLGATAEDIDAGDFQVLVGPNLGATAAGRNLGRFADLLGPEARSALRRAARREENLHPERIIAEICYLPRKFRSANVTVRPSVRLYEVTHRVGAGVDRDHTIPLDELMVSIRSGRFFVRWVARDVEVRFASGHMLNWMQSPPACQLLSEIDRDGMVQFSSFDWGQAGGFVFLPRIQSGRSILQCAQWRVEPFARQGEAPPENAAAFADWFARWRTHWLVPRHVYLASADNRLLYDLEDPAQVDDLRGELQRARDQGQCLLQEALPGPEHAWLRSAGGEHHVVELVVSLAVRAPEKSAPIAAHGRRPTVLVTPDIRLRTPGSDWLFLKLYGPRTGEDDLLAGSVREFCAQIHSTRGADEWFFVRYADPDPHLRLRFHGAPQLLTGELFPQLCAWASRLVAEGVCHKFAFDTYEREVERYGGPEGATASESIFAADSRAVTALLESGRRMDRVLLGVATTDDLLSALGLGDDREKLAWLKEVIPSRKEFGEEYRARRDELVAVLKDPARLGPVDSTLRDRRAALIPLASLLAELESGGKLTQPLSKLYSSYVHMHWNRLSGEPASEKRILALLLRARDSILHRSNPS